MEGMEGIEEMLKALMRERLNGEEGEAFDTMSYRVSFTKSLAKSMIEGGGISFSHWLFKNEGEVSLVQLLLPKGMAEGLKGMANSHRDRCEDCEALEECKEAGIYDDPVRTVLTEILKIGFAEFSAHLIRKEL